MAKTIEKEIKTAITQEVYNQLLDYFPTNSSCYLQQHNIYYDTPEGTLRQAKCGLRTRQVNNNVEFTLKESIRKNEKLEITDSFILSDNESMFFPKGDVSNHLQDKYNVSVDDLIIIGELINERYDIHTKDGIWAIDKSHFPDGVTFELEFEYTTNQEPFFNLLKQFNIPFVHVSSKLSRALFK